jgi:hypothetical protein
VSWPFDAKSPSVCSIGPKLADRFARKTQTGRQVARQPRGL